MTRQLILLGGGPAHLGLLAQLAKQMPHGDLGDVKITLISRNQRYTNQQLLPEFVAGRMALNDCSVDLEPLVQKTRIQWIEAQTMALDAAAQALTLADGQENRYDWLSIDLEPVQNRKRAQLHMPGSQANGLFVRPTAVFCKLWPGVVELAATQPLRVAIICDSASAPASPARADEAHQEIAAIELAMAINHALPHCATTLITGGAPLASASTASIRDRLAKTLKRKKLTVLADSATAIQPGEIVLASGATLACDVPVLATAASPPAVAASSGLALDAQGFISVDASLRSVSHPNVVVASGSDLHNNLVAHTLTQATGLPFSTATDHRARIVSGLRFVSTSDGHAIAGWRGYSASGRMSAWLKRVIDHSRMASYRPQ